MQYQQIRLRNNRQKKQRHWSRVFMIVLAVVIVILAAIAGYFYWALYPVQKLQAKAESIVFKQTDIESTDQFLIDNRDHIYYTIIGDNKSGTTKVAIIDQKTGKVTELKRKAGLSDNQLNQLLTKEYHASKIYNLSIGLYEKVPVFEISYTDQKGKLNYITLDYYTGENLRSIYGF